MIEPEKEVKIVDAEADYFKIKIKKDLRAQAAIAAMQGAWWNLTDCARPQHISHAAKICVQMADELLKELEK